MSWLRNQYPIGKEFEAPDPDTGQPVPVTVTGYWRNTMSRDTGIEVETSDGREFNISASYLWENGNGTYETPRAPGRPKLDDSDPTVRIIATVPASIAAKAAELGNGNVSAGVRLAIEQA